MWHVQTAVLSMMYITALSAVFVSAGIIIRNADEVYVFGNVPVYIDLLFAGGFLAALFWVGRTCSIQCNSLYLATFHNTIGQRQSILSIFGKGQ